MRSPHLPAASARTVGRPAALLLPRLEGVREFGPGRWMARCPAHDDRRPSLSIREADDGRLLIHDFADCATVDVLAAVGLTMADLFEQPSEQRRSRPRVAKPSGAEVIALLEEAAVAIEVALAMLADGTPLTTDDRTLLREHFARVHRVRQEFRHA